MAFPLNVTISGHFIDGIEFLKLSEDAYGMPYFIDKLNRISGGALSRPYEADIAKAEADKAKAEADKAKAEADKAKAEADKAKIEADKAKIEAALVKEKEARVEDRANAKAEIKVAMDKIDRLMAAMKNAGFDTDSLNL
jgi:chemotaxis protein histidine kinase CheA